MSVADMAYQARLRDLAHTEDSQVEAINADYYRRFYGTGMESIGRKAALMRLGGQLAAQRQEASDQYALDKATEAYQKQREEAQRKLAEEANKKNWWELPLEVAGTAAQFAALL